MPNVTDYDRDKVGVPKPFFTYTVDQVCLMLQVTEKDLFKRLIWQVGREFGGQPKNRIAAVNIEPDRTATPEWRVEEGEFIRWAKFAGFRRYERGWARS